MIQRIVWGGLADPATLAHALGRAPESRPLTLPDHALLRDRDTQAPLLVPAPGASAKAAALSGLTEAETATLDFLDIAMGAAQRFAADGLPGRRGDPGDAIHDRDPADPALAHELIAELVTWQGEVAPEALARRRRALGVVASSRVRARSSAPATLRHHAAPGDVAVAALRHPYAAFFALEEYDTAWRRFDGTMGPPATRAVFISGDAVTVLPYDPLRDRVLLVEQYRAGPTARGDAQPWQFETVAGRIDPGESPEAAARREAVEEAGLSLTDLRFVAGHYPSPGAVSEYLYSYVALTALPDGCAGVFGMEAEHEDIRGHLVDFQAMMAMVGTGEIQNAPLILTALWLQRERSALRATRQAEGG